MHPTTRRYNIFLGLLQHYPLIVQMIKREVTSRYRGSFLGLLWSLVNPILMLTIYTFVFGIVFKVRLDQNNSLDDDKIAFALLLFAGLIVYNLFSECISRAPGLILTHVNYVKKIIFPLDILPWVTLGAALFHCGISYLVLFAFTLLMGYSLHWTIVFLPIVVLPLLFFIMGLSWLLASIGVFVRDIGQFIGLILTMLLFLSPIFYPISALPEALHDYIFLNPLAFIIEQTRGIILVGNLPDWTGLAVYYLIALSIAWLGFTWFEKTRKGFADVL